MDRKEREAEGEVRAGKDGESLDEDVGDSLVAGEVGVELVAVAEVLAVEIDNTTSIGYENVLSDRANNSTSVGGGIQSPSLG